MSGKTQPRSPFYRFRHAGTVLSVFLSCVGAAALLSGRLHLGPCSVTPAQADVGADAEESHEHGSQAVDPNELERAQCEHGIATVTCDRCRFELGVVKLDPAVAKTLIKTDVVRQIELAETLGLTGQVQWNQTRVVDVLPTVGGRIKSVEKLLGQTVREGDVLAVIHSSELSQAKAEYLEAQAKRDLAQTTFAREKDLSENRISSQADYLAASNELKLAKAGYAAAEKRLRAFGLNAEEIEAINIETQDDHFADLVVRSPLAGTVTVQDISVGTLVEPTQSLCIIADLSSVWVWCDLYEKDLAALHGMVSAGQPVKATVRVKAFKDAEFGGVVDLIGSTLDEHTRTVKVRIQVENRQGMLRPGMFAEAQLTTAPAGMATVISRTAVLSDEGRDFVFEHWKDDLWIRRDVVLGRPAGEFVEVLHGLRPDATVVTSGAFMLKSDILREKMGAGCAD